MNPEVPGAFVADDYYDVLADLRRDAPLHRYAPNCWTVARYADIRKISRDPDTFVSGRGVLANDPLRSGGTIEGSILHMDPPEHAPWRRLTSRRFTPNAVRTLEPQVRRLARELLARAPRNEPFDFVERIGAPFPVLVIADLLGIDEAHHEDFRRWSDATIEAPDRPDGAGPDDAKLEDLVALHRFLVDQVRSRRAEPRDDIVTLIAGAEIDGRPVTTREAVTYVMSLLVAGNETTRHLLSGAVAALHDHPDQRAQLVGDTALVPGAVEECLRWVTPIQAFGRTAVHHTTVGDQPVEAGDFLVMLYASANRDEAAFGPTAAAFDVRRGVDAQHLAFGFGEHLCLGAALARLEARVFLEELLRAAPDYQVCGDPTWVRSSLVRGMTTLPIRLPA